MFIAETVELEKVGLQLANPFLYNLMRELCLCTPTLTVMTDVLFDVRPLLGE